jgi:hypothetical protein
MKRIMARSPWEAVVRLATSVVRFSGHHAGAAEESLTKKLFVAAESCGGIIKFLSIPTNNRRFASHIDNQQLPTFQ